MQREKLEYTVYKLLVALLLSPVACLSIDHTSLISGGHASRYLN